jgi:HlyD family secretion protein
VEPLEVLVKKLIVIVVLLALATGAIIYLRHAPRQEDAGVIRISGNVELTEVQVSFKVPGRVSARLVDEGAKVRQGEVVARLEEAELNDELKLAQSDAEAAAANLSELQSGYQREEIKQGEALLARAEAEAQRAATDYQREVALYAREVVPKRE